MRVTREISREQYIAALIAFGEAVGLDPAVTTLPLILAADRIDFSVVVPDENGQKQLTWDQGHGTPNSILAATGHIEVV